MSKTMLSLVIGVLIIISCLIYRTTRCQHADTMIRIHYLLDESYHAQPALKDLLLALDVTHDNTLDSIVATTQQTWLRKAGQERWHIEKIYEDKRALLTPYFYQLGMVQELRPTKKHYTYVLFLGATVQGVRVRLAYLLYLWQQGIRFDTIVFLGGQRPLDAQIENADTLLNNTEPTLPFKKEWQLTGALPTVEIDMMRMVLEQTDLPEELQKIPVVYIDVPMTILPDGKLTRPTTGSTFIAWHATNPKPGSCLAISCQPHVNYQDTVIRTYLPQEFELETVGRATNPEKENPGVILDAIARCLYQAKVWRDTVK